METEEGSFNQSIDEVVNEIQQSLYKECESSSIVTTNFTQKISYFNELDSESKELLKNIFKLTKIKFTESNELHRKLLFALHFSITKCPKYPPLKGPQWTVLGFQGFNPTTDLRGTGLLGLFFPLILFSKFNRISKDILDAAFSPKRQFPMMLILIVCVNCTFETITDSNLVRGSSDKTMLWKIIILFYIGLVEKIAKKWSKCNWNIASDFNKFKEIMEKAKSNCFNIVNNVLQVVDEKEKKYLCL